MKIKLEFNNISQNPLKKSFFESIIKKTFLESKYIFLKKKKISVDLTLVGKTEMKKVNKKYRNVNSSTDILSFAEYRNVKEIEKSRDRELFLGELILCYDDIREYIKKEKLDLGEEVVRVVSHGILHLLGFKHGKKMFEIQNKISKKNFYKSNEKKWKE